MHPSVLRILDANLNRTHEALRVMEEHARFVLDDAAIAGQIKTLRHEVAAAAHLLNSTELLAAHDTASDVGATITAPGEMSREGPADVAAAACKRAAEAMRCLEEYGKSVNPAFASKIEQLRYQVYIAEQALIETGPRRARLRAARLHVLITESLCRGHWLRVCEQAIEGGADVLQLREKTLPDLELLNRAKRLRELTAARGVLFGVNDRPDIARLAGADGIHVGQEDLPVPDARRIAGPTILVGRSTHSMDEVCTAASEGADYIAVGPMFEGTTKPNRPVQGPALLAAALDASNLPIVAIGGITSDTIDKLFHAACGRPFQIAVCQSIIASTDPMESSRKLKGQLIDSIGP